MIRLLLTFTMFVSIAGFVMADEPAKKDAPAKKELPASQEAGEKDATPDATAGKDGLDLSTDRLKSSYGIGLNIGKQLKGEGLELDVDAMAAGLRDVFEGGKPRLTNTEFSKAIAAFQQEMRVKLAERKKVQGEKNKAEGSAFLAENAKRKGIVTLASGLQYEVIKKGEGDKPTKKDRVKTHYHGTLIDGTVFDSSVERGEPISFGVTGVIPGWTEALQLMQEGDKWRLFVPSELAYAERGAGDDIGPHATLIFEVELLEVE